jgi:hypothetical protein
VFKKYDSHIIAVVGTLVFMVLVFLLLWFLRMTFNPPKEEKDIVVTFDVMEDLEVPEEEVVQEQEKQAAPELGEKPVSVTAKATPPLTVPLSTSQSSPAVQSKDTVSSDTEINDNVTKMFAKTESVSNGDDNQPSPILDHTKNPVPPGPNGGKLPGGGGWELDGRDVISIDSPDVSYNEEFTVVVDITVNAKGDVIFARYTHKGSKGYNSDVVKAAEATARKAKFTSGEGEQRGQITFVFKF